MKKYYIYHIPGVKIGVSEEPENRVNNQGYTDYEILEEFTCIYLVSYRERVLQKEYGYPVDKIPYYMSRQKWGSPAGKKGGQKAVESGQLYEMIANRDKNSLIEQGRRLGKIGGPKGGKSAVETGQLAEARTKAFETNNKIVKCPYCDKEGKKLNMSVWHFDKCKHKPTST